MGGHIQTRDFLAALFDPHDLIELRILPARKQLWCNGPDEVVAPDMDEYLTDRNCAGENIYFGANPRSVRDGSAKSVALARCLFVDWDGLSLEACRGRLVGLPEPTAIVSSGGGFHAYWRLAEPIADIARWTAFQKMLAKRLGSDPVVNDGPRIMRLPGYANTKRAERVLCTVVSLDGGAVDLAAFGFDEPQVNGVNRQVAPVSGGGGDAAPFAGPPFAPALTMDTLRFLASGAPEGERNARLFKAAVDAHACGQLTGAMRSALIEAGTRSGLTPDECEATIRSAASKPREPAKLAPVDDGWGVIGDDEPAAIKAPAAAGPAVAAPAKAPPAVRGLPTLCIANVVLGTKDPESGKRPIFARAAADVLEDIQTVTKGGLKCTGGILFGDGETFDPDTCPTSKAVQWLSEPNDLFAWLLARAALHWPRNAVDAMTKEPRNTTTKGEFFSFCEQNTPDYFGVEFIPHHPRIHGVLYAGGKLGAPWEPEPGTGKLFELIGRLNAATDIDRSLMLAMFLTPGWGGPPGCRPIFVLDSPGHGAGTGKTVTAELVSLLWGSAISIAKDERIEDVRKRLLSDTALGGRVVLADNVKGRQDSAGLESLVTAPAINGHRMYAGNASRPNLLTYIITANTPRLSKDLSERSYIIHVGGQKHADASFVEWARGFVAEHRASMIADALAVLKRDAACDIPPDGRDRWGAWQDAVLARVPDGDLAAVEAKQRRVAVDVDTEDAEDIAAAIVARIKAEKHMETGPVRFTLPAMREVLVEAGIADDRMTARGIGTWLMGMAGVGPLQPLARTKAVNRYWLWSTDPADDGYAPIIDARPAR